MLMKTCRKCGAELPIEEYYKHPAMLDGYLNHCKKCVRERVAEYHDKNPLYDTWAGMRRRCDNPNHKFFKNYGGRGIKVCDKWSGSFESFRDWAVANGYRPGLTIDRVDNDGNYEPGNCRWSTWSEQARNRRNTTIFNGKPLAELCESLGLNYKTCYQRLYRGKISPF